MTRTCTFTAPTSDQQQQQDGDDDDDDDDVMSLISSDQFTFGHSVVHYDSWQQDARL